jgi:hypothetical protein
MNGKKEEEVIFSAKLPDNLERVRNVAAQTQLPLLDLWFLMEQDPCPVKFWQRMAYGGSGEIAKDVAEIRSKATHEVVGEVYQFKLLLREYLQT